MTEVGASGAVGRPLRYFAAVAATTLVVDGLSKALVLRQIGEGGSVPVAGGLLRFTVTSNAGSAFSLLQHRENLLVGIGAAVCVAILALIARRPDLPCRHMIPLALIWGGSLGNLVDRLRRGAVVDFIDVRVWPVFNAADVAISAGFLLLSCELARRA